MHQHRTAGLNNTWFMIGISGISGTALRSMPDGRMNLHFWIQIQYPFIIDHNFIHLHQVHRGFYDIPFPDVCHGYSGSPLKYVYSLVDVCS